MRVFHFISDQYALDVVADQRIKVSRIDDLNDPFELHAVDFSDRKNRKEFQAFKKHISERYGMLCFSRRWKSPLLWSHYANRHKGVALDFDVPDNVAHPIIYRRNRYVLDVERSRNQLNGFDKDVIKGIWFTKYEQWKYEEEIRVVLRRHEFYQDRGIFFYNLGSEIHLKGIVLGPLCNITISEIKSRLANSLKISVIKSRLAFRSFDVVKNIRFKTEYIGRSNRSAQ